MIGDIDDIEAAWRMAKWGFFSASEISDLMTPGTGSNAFSKGGLTYIEKISRQAYTLFNDSENIETWSMRRGKMKEAEAFKHYYRLMGSLNGMEYFGGGNPYFEHYCPDSGSSPDCLTWVDKSNKIVSFGSEFKSPNSNTHWDYLREIKDQWDLKKASPQYYGQCQFGMLTFKADLWHWSSYNEYYPFKDQMLIIEVQPDKQYQDNLRIRLKMAVKMKYQLIEEMKNR